MDDALAGDNAPALSGVPALPSSKPLAIYDGDAAPILERLRQGERVKVIAQEHGVSHQAVYAFLLQHCPDEWRAISASRSLSRMETAEHDMDDAEDNVQVSKARESHRMAAWQLERVARGMYGDNKDAQAGVNIQVIVQRDGGVTIEGERGE
jgi:hypothetical protein